MIPPLPNACSELTPLTALPLGRSPSWLGTFQMTCRPPRDCPQGGPSPPEEREASRLRIGLDLRSFLVPDLLAFGMKANRYVTDQVGDLRPQFIASCTGICSDEANNNTWLPHNFSAYPPGYRQVPGERSGFELLSDPGPNLLMGHHRTDLPRRYGNQR